MCYQVKLRHSFVSYFATIIDCFPVPSGKAIAVLCPINGEGRSCPMMYKVLNVGQGTHVAMSAFFKVLIH